ncbi:MAG TPA: hypothetical protein DIW27_12420, partial [Cytophagales bacterium]|nr:hypothetical protein [Cytophagales bacterium]
QVEENKFEIRLLNYEGILPVDIQIDDTSKRTQLSKKAIIINSQGWPQIDPRGYYLKRVILE